MKAHYQTETYLQQPIPWRHRRILTQFRCGSAPLRLETGRYERLPVSERTCSYCLDAVEDERHVITECPLYRDLREELYAKCHVLCPDFYELSSTDKLCVILANHELARTSSRILFQMMEKRRQFIYT